MILLFFLLPILTQSLSPIRSILNFDQGPYVLAKFEKNKCHQVNLHMRVFCNSSGFVNQLGHLQVSYGDINYHINTLWGNYIDNKFRLHNIFNNEINIRNSTKYNPKLSIVKGDSCQDNPISIDIYKMDINEIDCNNLSDSANTFAFSIGMGLLTLFFLMIFSDACRLGLFLQERQRERQYIEHMNSVNEMHCQINNICDCNK